MPFGRLLLLLAAVAFFVVFVQIGALRVAFDRLGLSEQSAYLLLMLTLGGSMINLPLGTIRADAAAASPELQWQRLFGMPERPFHGRTLIAVNLGGAVTPVAFSFYLLAHNPLDIGQVLEAVAVVAMISRLTSTAVAGVGITMPFLIAPVTAAMTAVLLDPQHAAPLAYVGGTMGVLLGADLMQLPNIRHLGAPVVAIGGAGTFDGIFLAGLLAVLIA